MASPLKKIIEENHIEFVDLRFCDLRGKEHHLTLPQYKIDDAFFSNGKVFDGSSIAYWCEINHSDLVLRPDVNSFFLDPFCETPTLNLRCDVYDPRTKQSYSCDPRAVAKRAEKYLKTSGIADVCYFGQEVEFFIFDDVRFEINMRGCAYQIDAEEGDWNSAKKMPDGNMGHRPRIKGGYFPVPPVDSSQDLRSTMCKTLMEAGLIPEVHHHEVATGNQNEIVTRYNSLLIKSDEMLIFKYIIQNVAHSFGKTVTFMPKPIVGDNGSGLHCHQSLAKGNKNLFAGDGYAGLSELALYYIGGIIKHARALNAFTNPATNSYKRLVPGFEAPVTMVYSESNRSAGIRIPHVFTEPEKRIEVRFPDALANPYLAFSAMLMAGLDGIKNKIHPGDPVDDDIYHLPPEKIRTLPCLCASLEQALDSLEADHAFLLNGDVFNNDIIQAYIQLKREEVLRLNQTTHPIEFDMYYSG